MKLKTHFTLTGLSGEYIAVPMGETDGFHGVVKLNASGAEVLRALDEGLDEDQCAARLMEKYQGLDRDTAKEAVSVVLIELRKNGLLED